MIDIGTLPEFVRNPDPKVYNSNKFFVIDFEVTNREFGWAYNPDNRIVCFSVLTMEGGNLTLKTYWPKDHDEARHIIEGYLAFNDFMVAHNAKFEIQWMDRIGIDTHNILCYDTMLAEWVILGNQKKLIGLDAVSKRYGYEGKETVVSRMIHEGVSPEDIPQEWLQDYCEEDVYQTYQVMMSQIPILLRDRLEHLVYARCLAVPVLADIEKRGMQLDPDRVREEDRRVANELVLVQARLGEVSGGRNLNSPKQLGELLYDELGFEELKDKHGNPIRTGSGARSTSSDVLGQLKARTKKQKDFLDNYEKYNKLISLSQKNLSFFSEVCDTQNGLFFGEFRQGTTGTHRLSGGGKKIRFRDGSEKGCQAQNMPREYKRLFRSRNEGWLVGAADGSQLEFRVATDLGNDPTALRDIISKVDIHQYTADTLTAAGEPTSRQDAKASTFAPLYGGNGRTKAQRAYAKAFRRKYLGIYREQTRWTQEVLKTKKLVTPYGLIFYWPDTKMEDGGYIRNTTQIFNYPIQGFATGEIIPLALVCFWHRIKHMEMFLVNTVHDSIVAELPPSEREEFIAVSKQAMTHDVYDLLDKLYGYVFKCPLGVGIKIAEHWDDTKEELKFDIERK